MIIASNFKTNYSRAQTIAFVVNVQKHIVDVGNTQNVRIFPPLTALDSFVLSERFKVGAQNFYPTQNGSFTGEVGFAQLEEFAVKSVLIGHSERRHILGETQPFIAQKYTFAMQKNVEIIYCVGEPKKVREQGVDAVMTYLWEQFEGIDINYAHLIVAYEPVWAIGTGLTASLEDINEVLAKLAEKLSTPLLYGGSVKVDNLDSILAIKDCAGVLVGTASWSEEAFCKMIDIAQNVEKKGC